MNMLFQMVLFDLIFEKMITKVRERGSLIDDIMVAEFNSDSILLEDVVKNVI